MLTWKELVQLSDPELERLDVAEMNLICAEGLPAAGRIDLAVYRRQLDHWAWQVEEHTNRLLRQFQRNPAHYHHSEAYFRALALITVLQRDGGVRYNPQKIPADAPFAAEDCFLYGILAGPGGTCATMPVLYAAVGRRLGYPIRLVTAHCHLFARWDAPDARFNIEGTAQGLSCPPDGYYRSGRYALPPHVIRASGHLQSQSPRQELAHFCVERALCWLDLGRTRKAVEAFAYACAFCPQILCYLGSLQLALQRWGAELRKVGPPIFPPLELSWDQRRFPPTLPEPVERTILRLETIENLLKAPHNQTNWWEPMRQGRPVARPPQAFKARFHGSHSTVTVLYRSGSGAAASPQPSPMSA
jgi:hypothetical protein